MHQARAIATFLLLIFAVLASTQFAQAFNPDEVLQDSQLEQRARNLSKEIRCMVCQNQSIDDSDATVAKDLRILIRERLTAGDSDDQVLEFLVARFGEFVLLKPRFSLSNAVLWLTPALFLGFGSILAFVMIRKNRAKKSPAAQSKQSLDKSEQAALTKILGDRE